MNCRCCKPNQYLYTFSGSLFYCGPLLTDKKLLSVTLSSGGSRPLDKWGEGGGGGHPDPEKSGGGGEEVSKENIFAALRASVWSKNGGGAGGGVLPWICHCCLKGHHFLGFTREKC